MDDDLRADIESAIGDDDGGAGDTGVLDTPGAAEPSPSAAPSPAEPPAPPPPEGGQVRDALGRFVPKAAEPPGAAQEPPGTPALNGAQAAQPAPVQQPAQAPLPTPQSWSPGVREEYWAKLPPAVQQEVLRREQEVIQAFRQHAPARQLGEQFMGAVQPYMTAIQAEGVDPITAVTNLLQFGTRMRMGTPGEKAATLAQLVQIYGVSIQDLDSALVGQLPPENPADNPNYVQQAVQQALMPLYQQAQQRAYQSQQVATQHAQTELEAFAPKHRFLNDLRNDMADLIDMSEKQGRTLSLEEAYERAGMLHPEISKIMIAERQGASAHQLTAAAQKAKAVAGVSVRGTAPAGDPNGAEPSSLRESIEAAIGAHSRV